MKLPLTTRQPTGRWTLAHARPVQRVAAELAVEPADGLSSSEAVERLAHCGHNVLAGTPGKTRLQIVWKQLTSIVVLVLIAAGVISLLLGELLDGVAIAAIVMLNAALGFQQEYRAERATGRAQATGCSARQGMA